MQLTDFARKVPAGLIMAANKDPHLVRQPGQPLTQREQV